MAMVSAKEHYDNMLARQYSWMCGDYDEKVRENRELFQKLGLDAGAGKRAVDLGCGSGFQSVALAELGYEVVAVDACAALLEELSGRCGGLPVTTVGGDLRDFPGHLAGSAAVITCMGDTLAHLESFADVSQLFAAVAARLETGGKFIISFRDQTYAVEGPDRVIPVRSEHDRILTAFLEYRKDRILVCDVLYEQGGEGWELFKSCYEKLRLRTEWIREQFGLCGLQVVFEEVEKGFTTLVASR